MIRLAGLFVCAAILAGCGGGGSDKDGLELMGCPADDGTIGTSTLTAAQSCVLDKVGATVDTSGPVTTATLNGCDISVVLTSKADLSLYEDGSGDQAQDPTGTVGFKADPTCAASLSAPLADAEKP